MGSFNVQCLVTGTPITYNDPVVMMLLVNQKPSQLMEDTPIGTWKPIGAAIRGTYDDYGSIEREELNGFGLTKLKLIEAFPRQAEFIEEQKTAADLTKALIWGEIWDNFHILPENHGTVIRHCFVHESVIFDEETLRQTPKQIIERHHPSLSKLTPSQEEAYVGSLGVTGRLIGTLNWLDTPFRPTSGAGQEYDPERLKRQRLKLELTKAILDDFDQRLKEYDDDDEYDDPLG